MNHRNFAFVMVMVSRFLCCLLLLLSCLATSSATPFKSKHVHAITGEFNPFEENGKIGLKNTKGDVLIPARYDKLGWTSGKFTVVGNVIGYQVHGLWGLITIENKKITSAEYDEVSPSDGSSIIARKKVNMRTLSGCIDISGKMIIPFQYDGISIHSMRAIVFEKKGTRFNHGLIDLNNKVMIPIQYAAIYPLGSLRYAVESFENKTAIFTEDGKQLTGFVIDSISSFKKDHAIIYQNQRQGLINRTGEIILDPVFRNLVLDDNGNVQRRMPDSWLFLEGGNKLIQKVSADSIICIDPNIFKLTINGITTLVDADMKPISKDIFETIGEFENGRAFFTKNGKQGILRKNGKIILNATFDKLDQQGTFVLGQKERASDRWMLMDSLGKALTTKPYSLFGSFTGKLFPVLYKGYWGAVNSQGKEIIACVHDSIVSTSGDYVVVKFRGQYGIIDLDENWIVTPQPNKLSIVGTDRYLESVSPNQLLKSFRGELIYFTQNKLQVYPDHLEELLPSGAVWNVDFHGVVTVKTSKVEGVQKVEEESEGYRAIKKDGRFGFIDSKGRLRIANRYEDARKFSEGLAPVKILGKWGFVNKEDKIAVQPVYEEVFTFISGRALVKQKGFYGLIDKSGRLIVPCRYDKIESLPNKRIVLYQNGMQGLADEKGQTILTAKYNDIQDLDNGFIIVKRDGKFGVITTEGISTIPLMYDAISYDQFHNRYVALEKSAWEVVKL
jgi:hypothetical protein